MGRRIRYPLGIQTFSKIIEGGYAYVDKTAQLYDMVEYGSRYIFLSRPRRFGKSLLVSTLKSYFEGRKELFEGLAIEKLEKNWIKYPVILLSLAGYKGETEAGLREYLNYILKEACQEHKFDSSSDQLGVRLKELIKHCKESTGQDVVVLIDEYDKPILNVVHDDSLRDMVRSVMSELYAPLKDCDPMLHFVFITGITKFSQMSIFSELNNITNASMRDDFASICGITLDEMESQLHEGIQKLGEANNLTKEETIEKLRYYYDGYAFCENSPEIFNPYSLINCLDEKKFKPYWFGSATPRYLVNMLRKFKVIPSKIAPCYASEEDLDFPDERDFSIIPFLYQYGYLSIKGYDAITNQYILDFPNYEVKVGLMDLMPTSHSKGGYQFRRKRSCINRLDYTG